MNFWNRTTLVADEFWAVFKFIPSPQLLKFRLVSKEWNEVAQMVLRKRRDVKIVLTTDNFDSRTNWKFLQFLNKSPENVFLAPVIDIKNANRELEENLEKGITCVTFEILREICEQLGNRGIVKQLTIEDGENAPHFTPDFVLELLGHFLALETLEIWDLQLPAVLTSEQKPKFQLPSVKEFHFDYKYGSNLKESANFLKMFLKSSPNLENFTCAAGGYWNINELDILSLLKETGRLSNIKGVAITKLEDLDIILQCKPKLALNSFKIHSSDIVDSKKLFTFLQQQAKSLKTFKFKSDKKKDPTIFTLPVLPVLEKLSFKSWSGECLLSANYGRQTPALKTLKISYVNQRHSWKEFLTYETPCLSVEEVQFSKDGQTSQKVFDNWKNIFPNVKKLIIDDPDQYGIKQFSKHWPKLKELTLRLFTCPTSTHKTQDLDAIAFGISPDWKKKIVTTEDDWWTKIPAPEIGATVANLKCLKKFIIEADGTRGTAILTDFAVYFGLRHMQNLEELEISSSSEVPSMEDVSTEAFDFLVKNLPKLEKLKWGKQKWKREEILK